jgi:isoleucyl-tRNA synthetase
MVDDDKLLSIDKWALLKLNDLVAFTRNSYDKYEFHTIFHAVHNFCVNDMSNFYLDVIKDRLYVEKATSESRRAAQTTIYKILDTLTLLIAPILAFTADEIWTAMPHDSSRNGESVIFNDIPNAVKSEETPFSVTWDRIHDIRNDVNKALEIARADKLIGKSLEAKITLHAEGELAQFLSSVKDELTTAFIVSEVELSDGEGDYKGDVEGLTVSVSKASGEKCARCWSYTNDVGSNAKYPDACARCATILG